jgi:hypothetical protein
MILPLETLPHGDPNGRVVYLRIVLSPEEEILAIIVHLIMIIIIIIRRRRRRRKRRTIFHLNPIYFL